MDDNDDDAWHHININNSMITIQLSPLLASPLDGDRGYYKKLERTVSIRSVKNFVLLCVHRQNDVFPFSHLSPLSQGNTLSLPLTFISLIDFLSCI